MTLAPALFSTPMMERLPERAKKQILQSAEFPVSAGGDMGAIEAYPHTDILLHSRPVYAGPLWSPRRVRTGSGLHHRKHYHGEWRLLFCLPPSASAYRLSLPLFPLFSFS
jgi:hypothetical protein